LSSNEGVERRLYEELIDRAVESLLEIYNALWIYDFEKAYTLASRTVEEIERELRRAGLSIDSLMARARSAKREIEEGETIEVPGHEITILAPIISRLNRIRKQVQQIVQMQRRGVLKPPERFDRCAILNVGEIYLARCWLQKPLITEGEGEIDHFGKALEKLLIHALNSTDLEINSAGTAIEATVWLQNMVMIISMVGSRLEIRIIASPKARNEPKEIEDVIKKIYLLVKLLE